MNKPPNLVTLAVTLSQFFNVPPFPSRRSRSRFPDGETFKSTFFVCLRARAYARARVVARHALWRNGEQQNQPPQVKCVFSATPS